MARYITQRKCFFGTKPETCKLYNRGDVVTVGDDCEFEIPKYFVPEKQYEKAAKTPEGLEELNKEIEEKEIGELRKKIKDAGGDYDGRWKAGRLRQKLFQMNKEKVYSEG